MKNLFKILAFSFLFVLASIFIKAYVSVKVKQEQTHNHPSANTTITTPKCKHTVYYGNVEICLPEVDSMTECYHVPVIKRMAESSSTEVSPVLAYYLNSNTLNKIINLELREFDDYLILWGSKKLDHYEASLSDLEQSRNQAKEGLSNEEWITLKKKCENRFEKLSQSLSIGKLVNVEFYSPFENVNSTVLLSKISKDNKEYVVIMISNILLLKNRLISTGYYKFYTAKESIEIAKMNNDKIIKQLVDKNL